MHRFIRSFRCYHSCKTVNFVNMNNLKTFSRNIPANDTDDINAEIDAGDRVLSVSLNTIYTHMRDPKFNNANTMFEIFAFVLTIAAEGRLMRINLKDPNDSCTFQGIYVGKPKPIKIGDGVRCVAALMETCSRLKIFKMDKIDVDAERENIRRLIAISESSLSNVTMTAAAKKTQT